ncbi:MAG: cytochrome b/b6 domain-containing protein [Roseivivax sp.]|nr:cytochrome b/b6 domain-containing protein [Roseivivax sp.]
MLGNSKTRYGAVAKTLHWTMAAGILAMIPLGIMATDAPFATADELARKAWLFSLHKTVGVALFFLALARIGWALGQPRPVPLHPERRAETALAETVHWLLYALLVLVPLTGWIHHAASEGYAPIWGPVGQSLPLVPKSEAVSALFSALHGIGETMLIGVLVLHIAGAVKHRLIDRDAVLDRMLPGRTEAGRADLSRSHTLPALAAAGVLVMALGAGAWQSTQSDAAAPVAAAPLAQAAGDWTVTEGTLGIAVSQFGATVEGAFSDWTAAIVFDPSVTEGEAGSVDVTVAIGSLTLGTVTAQAVGADMLDAAGFATARFAGTILRQGAGYSVPGTLSLKGAEQPLTLTMQIDAQDGMATATGQAVIDRRAFGIGAAMTDPGQLGFEVPITIAVTAARG